jgi:phenylalanyl-tRNA synthetase beta chain
MRAVWSWLLELARLDREVAADEGARLFTGAGLEVEGFEEIGAGFSGVVIAEVVAAEKHPKADKLTVVDVIDRAGGEATRVVCGAPNVPAPGGRVLWARPGARLTTEKGPLEIGVRPLKGVESAGMLCSEVELGIGDDAGGIMVLEGAEARSPLGTDAAEALRVRDAVLEVSVAANRGDVLGHLGLARELVALVGGRLRGDEVDLAPVTNRAEKAAARLAIEIDDPIACPRYLARVIDGVTVRPSPGWMRRRLRAVGVRPISNLVDVTNYVLFELGHPLHAFDERRVEGGRIRVRRAVDGEKLKTLDGQDRALAAGDILICDAARPVALGGVMGGLDSEVAGDTSRILLEAAAFDALSVRRTARRLGLHSEASLRFGRGVDPEGAERASRRAARLLAELGGGRVASGVVDAYPRPPERALVAMRASRASSLSGIPIDRAIAKSALGRLGVEVRDGAGSDELFAVRPSWRPDLAREVDLIEDVLRIHGYQRIPATVPRMEQAPRGTVDRRPEAARRALGGLGWSEAITFGFTSADRTRALGVAEGDPRLRMVALRNPMTSDHSIMRTSLLPNLLVALSRNLKFGLSDVALFEVGSVFLARGADELPDEPARLAGVLAGRRIGWLGDIPPVDFYDARGAVEVVLAELLTEEREIRFERLDAGRTPFLHPGVAADVLVDGALVGQVGEVHPAVRAAFEIEARAFAFDLDVAALPEPGPRQMRPIVRFPAITRDLSLFVSADLPAAQVGDLIRDPLIEGVRVLEEYRDPDKVPPGQKGLLWSITYRSSEKTLTDAEVDSRHETLVAHLLEKLAATRR